MNYKDKLEIDKNKIPFEIRKNINLALNRDGYALVDTKWLVEENFERKKPTIENVINSDYIYVSCEFLLISGKSYKSHKGVEKIKVEEISNYTNLQELSVNGLYVSIDDYKKTWAFSPCDLEGSIWIS